jgi:hypothetical protein
MAASIEVCNRALTLLGVERVVSVDDDSKAARDCRSQYDITRKSELRANRWAFAMRRAQLAAISTAPLFGFDLAYTMPTDCVRLDFVGDYYVGVSLTDYRSTDESAFAIEGRQILTNLTAPLNVRYIANVEDVQGFDPLFVDTLAHRLAIDLCESLTQSSGKKAGVAQAYALVIDRAKRVNAIERPPEPIADDAWVLARL